MAERFTLIWAHPRGIMDRSERDEGDKILRDLQIDRAFRIIQPHFGKFHTAQADGIGPKR